MADNVKKETENRIAFEIIVVCYNAGEKLKYTLDSIYNQAYKKFHVTIKDGKSTDDSLNALMASDYFLGKMEITDIFSEKDQGIYDGMNVAVQKMQEVRKNDGTKHESKGDTYVIFMNCGDSFYDKQTLGYVADYIEEYFDKKAAAEESPYIFYGNQFNKLTKSVVASSPRLREFDLYRNVPCHQVCFYDIALFEDRAYDVKYAVRADYEHFIYSVYERQAKTCYIDCIISSYEGGGFSETKENRRKSSEEHMIITEKYMGKNAKKYRMIMKLSGAGLRTRLAESDKFSGIYNAIKSTVYRKRNR